MTSHAATFRVCFAHALIFPVSDVVPLSRFRRKLCCIQSSGQVVELLFAGADPLYFLLFTFSTNITGHKSHTPAYEESLFRILVCQTKVAADSATTSGISKS